MRKAVAVIIVIICIMSISVPAYCVENNALKKLGRGLCNCVTFPLEVPQQMSKVNSIDGPMAGLTWGLLKGIGMAGVRAVVGVYEVVSFAIPYPACYEPILTDPEFVFEEDIW